jgi:hypothetical protein
VDVLQDLYSILDFYHKTQSANLIKVFHTQLKKAFFCNVLNHSVITKLRGLSPRANYIDRAAAAGRRS